MAEIANASGFAIGTLYQFFEGKENLYTTMVSEKLDKMYAEIRQSVNREAAIFNKLEELVRSHFRFVENNVDFCNLLIRGEGATLSNRETALRDKIIADHLNHIGYVEYMMRWGTQTEAFKIMEPRVMAYALLGIIRSFIYGWMLTAQDTSLCDKVECVLDIFLNGVRAGVSK
jgi:AcrR family transcriptional regulator